jgi:hypothetical protein
MYGTRCEAVPNQQDDMTQPGIYYVESGVTMETNISDVLSSGACLTAYGINTDTKYIDSPNQQPNIQETGNGITLGTNTSVDPEFGAFLSYPTNSLQDVKPIHEYTPHPLIIPRYSLPLTPPDNPSDSSLMQ